MLLTYPPELPISACRAQIVEALRTSRVLVVAGDTGSGKTTQLPKMCLEAGRGRHGLIGCTQPRRIAAVAMAERVAEELREPAAVSYRIRFSDQTTDTTRIKFMTDGILLAESRGDRLLLAYDTLIIDEAHERSLNIDFLLGHIKGLLARRKDLNLVISSATIDTARFSAHFDGAPVIEVSGRTYPVEIHHEENDDETYVERAVIRTLDLARRPAGGDILVFMPTERDIMETVDTLAHQLGDQALVLPLFGRLQGADQRRIFRPAGRRKIIVATNIAETSITVPGIRFVVDTGLARQARYNVRARTTSLLVSRVSQASCRQRTGRCGRTGPGACYRLYSEEDYQARPEFTLPEIQRSNLAEVILQMVALDLGDPRTFPFIDPPSPGAIREGYQVLRELGALDRRDRITDRGRIMARLPLDPRIARIIIEGAELGALREILIIAAALSIQDPRIRPADREAQADAAHKRFAHEKSDFLSFVNIWDAFHAAPGQPRTAGRLRRFCRENHLSWQRMREWFDIHDQLRRQVQREKRFRINTEPASYEAIHQALSSGFLRNIGQRREKNVYQAAGGREIMLFPGSSLYNRGGKWIVAAEFVETSRLFARTAATIDEQWLERLGGELCRRSWSDPHWSRKAGRVVALERVTLFGLTIVAGRRVNYGRINPATREESRQIFIRQALVRGELGGRYPFLEQNLDLVRTYTAMEQRIRRRDILVDEEAMHAFYDRRLPPWVHDRHTLNRFLRKKKNQALLCMQEDDLCRARPDADELYRFPSTLRTGSLTLGLSYLFEPGHEADGVTVEIPQKMLAEVEPSVFEWLVPGLLPEKVLHLLKRLPKKHRRRLVPLPRAVDRILDGLDLYQGSLYPALERVIRRCYQVEVRRDDWRIDTLPPHLRMRFEVVDKKGRVLAAGRSLAGLRRRQPAGSSGPAGRKATQKSLPKKEGITDWDFAGLREPLQGRDPESGQPHLFHPALFLDREDSLSLRYIPDRETAVLRNREGMRWLYGRQFAKEYRALVKECRAAVRSHSASWLALGCRATAGELKERLAGCVMDRLFHTWSGEIPEEHQWHERLAAVRDRGLLRAGQQELQLVIRILVARRKARSVIMQWAERARKTRSFTRDRLDHYLALLAEVVPPDFPGLDPAGMEHMERYLQALVRRIERAEQAPAKDAAKAARLEPALRRLARLAELESNGSCQCREAAARFRFMVNEFRVSLFAPELGTAVPVSEKRLEKQWQQVQDLCRRVEG